MRPTVLSPHGGPGVQWLQTTASSVVHAACCFCGLPYRTSETALSRGRSCLNSCYPQSGLQMGTLGKPQGTMARAHIGQIMSIHTMLQNKEHVIGNLHRAKFKFPGCQKIRISKKWGFTESNAQEFEDMMAGKQLIPNVHGVKHIPNRGPLDKWRALCS